MALQFWIACWTQLTEQCACRLHNLAHVELNAIDLAWDTVARFSHMGLPQVGLDGSPCIIMSVYDHHVGPRTA